MTLNGLCFRMHVFSEPATKKNDVIVTKLTAVTQEQIPTKRISLIFHILIINKMMPLCNLFMGQRS